MDAYLRTQCQYIAGRVSTVYMYMYVCVYIYIYAKITWHVTIKLCDYLSYCELLEKLIIGKKIHGREGGRNIHLFSKHA